jgi:radical SAM family RiPP maturation amino acid epimerase
MEQVTEATLHYRRMFSERTPEQLRTLAHIKRFLERLVGDPGFREQLTIHIDNPQVVADQYGIDVDVRQLASLYDARFRRYRFTEERDQWPLGKVWDDYIAQMVQHRDMLRDEGDASQSNPRFDKWRRRQIERTMSELGSSGPSITHPLVALELSEGCTVGCWFCGLSADRFKGYWPYTPENAELWQGCIGVLHELFGSAARTGFCYWATDPCDNPDYDRFIEDYYHITGALPQTTTAAPLKDVELTRRILGLFDKYKTVTNRFSVINLKMLERIHATFTAEELMGVELVMQNREAWGSKANAGRAMERRLKLKQAGKDDKIDTVPADHSTIACVSGFLVNMLERKIQLVSPTRGSEAWPTGYRIYAEDRFADAAEFRAIIEGMVEAYMPETLRASDRGSFRPDLEYTPLPDGFELKGPSRIHRVTGAKHVRAVGDLLDRGDLTVGELLDQVVDQDVNIFLAAELLEEMFTGGLLDDDPKSKGRQRALAEAS